MDIPQDISEVIIDQLASESSDTEFTEGLRHASLVSTAWVNRCQSHLFSTVTFSRGRSLETWRSRTRRGPDGVSKHVRTLTLGSGDVDWPTFIADDLKTALPCLTSFRNLRELRVEDTRINLVPYEVLIPIFSSFASSLKRLSWHPGDNTWTVMSTLVNFLPNLVDLSLSGLKTIPQITSSPLPRIRLSGKVEYIGSFKFKHFKFQELRIEDYCVPHLPSFLEHCRTHLRALDIKTAWAGGTSTL